MATIQVRNVPEDVHRTYRRRAAAAGMSLQEYLRLELERGAALRTPDELVEEVEDRIRSEGTEGWSRTSAVEVVRQDRSSH